MGGLREYHGELREFPDKSSNFGLLYGRVYGPLTSRFKIETFAETLF